MATHRDLNIWLFDLVELDQAVTNIQVLQSYVWMIDLKQCHSGGEISRHLALDACDMAWWNDDVLMTNCNHCMTLVGIWGRYQVHNCLHCHLHGLPQQLANDCNNFNVTFLPQDQLLNDVEAQYRSCQGTLMRLRSSLPGKLKVSFTQPS